MQPEEKNPIQKIIIIGISAVLLFSGLYFFVFNKTGPSIVFDQFGNPVQAQVVGQDLVDLLDQLQSVELDESLFSKQAFINLSDYAITLPNEPQGRANPFSPLSGR
jgi:hypothetical protein